jgi:hypothetical protein
MPINTNGAPMSARKMRRRMPRDHQRFGERAGGTMFTNLI